MTDYRSYSSQINNKNNILILSYFTYANVLFSFLKSEYTFLSNQPTNYCGLCYCRMLNSIDCNHWRKKSIS